MPKKLINKLNWPALSTVRFNVVPDDSFNIGSGITTITPNQVSLMWGINPNGYEANRILYPEKTVVNPYTGENTIIYNPKTNNRDSISLDALHIMHDSPIYLELYRLYLESLPQDFGPLVEAANDEFGNLGTSVIDKYQRGLPLSQEELEIVEPIYDALLRRQFAPDYMRNVYHGYQNKATLPIIKNIGMSGDDAIRNYMESYPLLEVVIEPNIKANGGSLDTPLSWDKLSMRDRAAYIRNAVSKGIYDIDNIRKNYHQYSNNVNLYKSGGKKSGETFNTDRNKYAVQYFMNKGLSENAAIGLVANFIKESSMNPSAVNPSSKAYGIGLWLGDRKRKLFKRYGTSPNLDLQLDFVWDELNSTYKTGLRYLKSAKTPEEAARYAMGYYEFSTGPEGAIREMNKYGQNGQASMNRSLRIASKFASEYTGNPRTTKNNYYLPVELPMNNSSFRGNNVLLKNIDIQLLVLGAWNDILSNPQSYGLLDDLNNLLKVDNDINSNIELAFVNNNIELAFKRTQPSSDNFIEKDNSDMYDFIATLDFLNAILNNAHALSYADTSIDIPIDTSTNIIVNPALGLDSRLQKTINPDLYFSNLYDRYYNFKNGGTISRAVNSDTKILNGPIINTVNRYAEGGELLFLQPTEESMLFVTEAPYLEIMEAPVEEFMEAPLNNTLIQEDVDMLDSSLMDMLNPQVKKVKVIPIDWNYMTTKNPAAYKAMQDTWNYFRKLGMSERNTASVMGNMMQESSFDPNIVQKGGDRAVGYFQMHGENLKTYNEWLKANKFKHDNYKQLEFIYAILNNKVLDKYINDYKRITNTIKALENKKYLKSWERRLLEEYKRAYKNNYEKREKMNTLYPYSWMISVFNNPKSTLNDVTDAFTNSYERPGKPMYELRRLYASDIYKKFAKKKALGGKLFETGGDTDNDGIGIFSRLTVNPLYRNIVTVEGRSAVEGRPAVVVTHNPNVNKAYVLYQDGTKEWVKVPDNFYIDESYSIGDKSHPVNLGEITIIGNKPDNAYVKPFYNPLSINTPPIIAPIIPMQSSLLEGITNQAANEQADNYANATSLTPERFLGIMGANVPIAATALGTTVGLPLAADYVAGTLAGLAINSALNSPWAEAIGTSLFGAHGLNHVINEGIDGYGDAAMTALEIAPMFRLAKPIYNTVLRAYNTGKGIATIPQITADNAALMTDAQWDTAYNAAIKSGDMAEAQRLRDLHFMAKTPDNVVTTDWSYYPELRGKPQKLYHGTWDDWNIFDPNRFGQTDFGFFGKGIYTTRRKAYAETYGDRVKELYGYSKNPLENRKGSVANKAVPYFGGVLDMSNVTPEIKHMVLNADGVNVYGRTSLSSPEYPFEEMVFPLHGRTIKLSDAITRDDAGNIIPLSQRDNFGVDDIRYRYKSLGFLDKLKNDLGIKPVEIEPTENYIFRSLNDARRYKESQGYKDLVQNAIKESEEIGTGTFPEEVFTRVNLEFPNITFSKRSPGSLGEYTPRTNTIDIDLQLAAGMEVPFHEGLHWQRVGEENLEMGPKYLAWVKSVLDDAPEEVLEALFKEVYFSPEYQLTHYRDNATNYLKRKTTEVLDPSTPKYSDIRKPHELNTHSIEAGRALGIEPFAEYPGYEEALTKIKEAIKYDSYLNYIKHSNEKEVKNFWKLLTGNYMPTVLGMGIVGTLLNSK